MVSRKHVDLAWRRAEQAEKDEKLQPTGCPCCGAGNYATAALDKARKLSAEYKEQEKNLPF